MNEEEGNLEEDFMDYLDFSKKEWEVLVRFWSTSEPLCCAEFSERFGMNRNTVLAVIRKLLNHGILEIESIKMSGSVLARRFQPAVTEHDVFQQLLTGDQHQALIKNVIQSIDSPEVCQELLVLIEEAKCDKPS